MKKIKELIDYNLTEFLLMCAITFICLFIEFACLLLLVNLSVTIGFLGFLSGICLMLFVVFIYLFIIVSIYDNL